MSVKVRTTDHKGNYDVFEFESRAAVMEEFFTGELDLFGISKVQVSDHQHATEHSDGWVDLVALSAEERIAWADGENDDVTDMVETVVATCERVMDERGISFVTLSQAQELVDKVGGVVGDEVKALAADVLHVNSGYVLMSGAYHLSDGRFLITPDMRPKLAAAMPVRHVKGGTYRVGDYFVKRVAQNEWHITTSTDVLLATRLYGNEACLAARMLSFGSGGLVTM